MASPARVGWLTVEMGYQPLPGASSPPVPVGEMLDRVLGRLGAPARAGVEVVFDRWADVVGEAMASRTRPVAIDGETLVVACDDPALVTHLRFLEPQLVARLSELTGARHLTRVEVRVDRRRRGPRPPRRPARRG
jgi:predicted nucleic acid-binding Zn ribbon protein